MEAIFSRYLVGGEPIRKNCSEHLTVKGVYKVGPCVIFTHPLQKSILEVYAYCPIIYYIMVSRLKNEIFSTSSFMSWRISGQPTNGFK